MPAATLFYCDGASPEADPPAPKPHVRKPDWHGYSRHYERHYWRPSHWNPKESGGGCSY
jgi:hypothetical protein